jgi:hypothetical protein
MSILLSNTRNLSFVKDQHTLKEVVDFINTFQIFLPRHVSADGCHPQGVVSAW